MLCEKPWAMLAKMYACKTSAPAAMTSAVPSLLSGRLIDLCRPLDGLDDIVKMILIEKSL